jgi:hypothetical protein
MLLQRELFHTLQDGYLSSNDLLIIYIRAVEHQRSVIRYRKHADVKSICRRSGVCLWRGEAVLMKATILLRLSPDWLKRFSCSHQPFVYLGGFMFALHA